MNSELSERQSPEWDALTMIGLCFAAVIVVVALIVSWCIPREVPKYPLCDYCKTEQRDAKPFPCRQCGKTHSSCGKESALRAIDARKDKEGFAVGRSIKVCPESDPK